MEDASLDEFVEGDSEEEEQRGDDESGPADECETEVEPATSTSRWARTGATCERCDVETSRLWEDDGAFVCRDCKDW